MCCCWPGADCALYRQADQCIQLHCSRDVLHNSWFDLTNIRVHPVVISADHFGEQLFAANCPTCCMSPSQVKQINI